jgi:hypothetical protein
MNWPSEAEHLREEDLLSVALGTQSLRHLAAWHADYLDTKSANA